MGGFPRQYGPTPYSFLHRISISILIGSGFRRSMPDGQLLKKAAFGSKQAFDSVAGVAVSVMPWKKK